MLMWYEVEVTRTVTMTVEAYEKDFPIDEEEGGKQ